MKIIGITCSPRPKSNSRYALEEAFKTLKNEGMETEIFDMNKLDVKPCQGCDFCKTNDEQKCAVKDDMQDIYESLKTADGILLASPIYMGQLSAQAKIFLDRLYAYFMSNWTEKYGAKKVAILITQGQPGKDLYKTNIDTYIFNFENIVKFQVIGTQVLTENNEPAAITEKDEQIEEAIALVKKFL